MRDILLAIHEKYAKKIINGTKEIELRKTFPDVDLDTKIFMYITGGSREVYSYFTCRVFRADLDNLYKKAMNRNCGLSKDEFYSYYSGKSCGVGLLIYRVATVSPITWKKVWPQNYLYLSDKDSELLYNNPYLTVINVRNYDDK